MISTSLRLDHFDPDEWRLLQKLLIPSGGGGGGSGGGASRGPVPPLVLLLEGQKTVAAFRFVVPGGERAPKIEDPALFRWEGPASLARHRRAAGARFAVAIDVTLAPRIAAEIDARLGLREDLVAQGLTALRAAKAELGRSVFVDPDVFSPLPVPSFAALQQTFDLLLPDDRAAGLFVYDRGRLAASGIVEKQGGHVVRLTSARALGAGLPGDFQAGRHRAVLDAMARHGLRPHAAAFLSASALREVLGPQPGALAQAVALRQAVLDPAPPWLLAFAGAGAAVGVAQTAGKLFGRFVPQSIKDTARETAKAFNPFASLGFDPVQLFSDLTRLF